MCGLTGYITTTKLSKEDKKLRDSIFKSLLIANQARGTDSTGIGFVKNNKVTILKNIDPAFKFLKDNKIKKYFKEDYQIMLGHTRQAVIGKITNRNAQPFICGTITGTHNGMINNYQEIDNKVEVDSEVVFQLLNKKKDVKKVFKKISGSCALAWYNQNEPDQLNLISHENPLCYSKVNKLSTIFYTSQEEHLQSVLYVLGFFGPIVTLKEDFLYKINNKLEITKEKMEFSSSYYIPKYYNYNYKTPKDIINDYYLDEEEKYYNEEKYIGPCDFCGMDIFKNGYYNEQEDAMLCPDCFKLSEDQDNFQLVSL